MTRRSARRLPAPSSDVSDPIHAAVDVFLHDLLDLVTASVVERVRTLLAQGELSPRTKASAPEVAQEWPLPGTNAHRVLELLRRHPRGLVLGELLAGLELSRKPLGKALDKLRERGRVRGVGDRGRAGFRYSVAPR